MKVVCICYDGSEISDETVNSIVTIVSPFAKDKSKVLVNRYGDKDIADALSVLSSKVVCFKTTESSVGEAVKKAACYIHNRFGSFFKNHVLLALSMVEVKHSEESTIFRNAASIILENRYAYSTVLEKNGITPEIVEVIKNVNM